uniref:DM2 domain-containing protein n=1 Tax=viral metagenome TaxID=1070528 RepID=A0A6C0E118_9ZZZZ
MSSNKTVAAKKTVSKKTVKEPQVVKEPVVVDVVVDEVVDESTEDSGDKRKVITKESVIQSFEDLIKSIESEMDSLREGDAKNKGIKFLRTLNKRLKILKNQSSRIIKQKRTSTKKNTNNNSGFLKPVKISTEMAKFTGWDKDELKSRVEVTKYLCQYIRDNNLQNPKDKRQILTDSKLQKLLRFDPKKETEPLTYFRLQTQLKSHFLKPDEVSA